MGLAFVAEELRRRTGLADAAQAACTALNDKPNGECVKWRNEASGHDVSLTPISRIEPDGGQYRDLVIRNFAGDASGGGTYRICRMEVGSWELPGGE
jgi:surface antigen